MLDIAIDMLFMPFNKLQCMLLQHFLSYIARIKDLLYTITYH